MNEGSFCGLLHFKPWTDNTGGHLYELAFTNVNNIPRMKIRSKAIVDGPFGKWYQIYQEGIYPNKVMSNITTSYAGNANFEGSGIISDINITTGMINTHTCLMTDRSRMMLGFLDKVCVLAVMPEANISSNSPTDIITLYNQDAKLSIFNRFRASEYYTDTIPGKIVADQATAPSTKQIWAW